MDIGKAFTFVFEDEDWIAKIFIGAAILAVSLVFSFLLIPLILGMALLSGYMVAVMRRVLNGQVDGLPQWENWGDLLIDGIKMWVIGVVYSLPILIAWICMMVPMAVLGNSDAEVLVTILIMLFGCIIILYSIVLAIVIPAAIAFWVASDDLGAAFRFGDILAFVRENLSTYLVTLIMSWVASLIGGLGVVVCGLGMLATLPYAYVVTGHLYGQAYMASSQQAAQPALDENWS